MIKSNGSQPEPLPEERWKRWTGSRRKQAHHLPGVVPAYLGSWAGLHVGWGCWIRQDDQPVAFSRRTTRRVTTHYVPVTFAIRMLRNWSRLPWYMVLWLSPGTAMIPDICRVRMRSAGALGTHVRAPGQLNRSRLQEVGQAPPGTLPNGANRYVVAQTLTCCLKMSTHLELHYRFPGRHASEPSHLLGAVATQPYNPRLQEAVICLLTYLPEDLVHRE